MAEQEKNVRDHTHHTPDLAARAHDVIPQHWVECAEGADDMRMMVVKTETAPCLARFESREGLVGAEQQPTLWIAYALIQRSEFSSDVQASLWRKTRPEIHGSPHADTCPSWRRRACRSACEREGS